MNAPIASARATTLAEFRASLLAAAAFFTLLGGYFVLRSMRDALGSEGDANEMAWNFSWTFVGVMFVTPLYARATARATRAGFAKTVYFGAAVVFAAWWVVLAFPELEILPPKVVRRGWFIWVSVFNLFATSAFWSLMADAFGPSQGRRLFGWIAAGGTAGAAAGGLAAGFLAETIGHAHLVWIEIVALILTAKLAATAAAAARATRGADAAGPEERVTPNAVEGAVAVARSPLLRNLAGYLAVATLTGAFLYNAKIELAKEAFQDRDARTAAFGKLDFWSNGLTLLAQLLIAGPLLRRFGAKTPLVVLPAVYAIGAGVAAAAPSFAAFAWTDVVGRAARHGVASPARNALFTAVSRTEKYKALAFIDTVVYRAGDVVSVWIYAAAQSALRSDGASLNQSLVHLSLASVPVALLWAFFGARAAAAAPAAVAAPERSTSPT